MVFIFRGTKQRSLHAVKAPLCGDMNSVQPCTKHKTSHICKTLLTTYDSELLFT